MAFETIIVIVALIFGIALLTLSNDKAVERSLKIAAEWKVSPLMIGLILMSIARA